MRRLLAPALAGLLLTGCGTLSSSIVAQVPTSGPIQQGEQVGTDPENQFIRVIARGPRPGMSPTEVVQGFLDASASFDGDHAVARQYLTPSANADWDTAQGVAIYEGVGALSAYGGTVAFRAAENGSISAIGRYEVASAGSELRKSFTLAKVGGEWRIDRVPPGLILSLADVDRSFRSLAIYFFNPTFSTLVPDARMIPVLGPGLATTLVRYLIDGPSDWLQPAVRTGFPPAVALNIEAVPIDAGIASVDLTANARLAGDSARQALSQQLVWTLRQLPDVTAVNITAGGQPLIVPGVANPQPLDSWPGVDPGGLPPGSSGYVVRAKSVARIVADSANPVAGEAGNSEVTFIKIAVSRDSEELAGVDGRGNLWRTTMGPGGTLTQVLERAAVSNPVFDRGGDLWGVDAEQGLSRIAMDGTLEPISIDGLAEDAAVRSAVPSRDGTRVALIVTEGPRTSLLVGRVVRAAPGGGISITAPISVESRLSEVLDLAWSGADSLAVLGSTEAGALQVFDVDLARGLVTALGAPEAPISVAAAPGMPTLVAAADGQVYELIAGNWQPKVRGTAPTYPN